jgi:hypothetical protein
MKGFSPAPRRTAPFWLRAVGIVVGVAMVWTCFAVVFAVVLLHNSSGVTLNAAWLTGIPVVLAIAGTQAYCLIDLARPGRRVRGRSKAAWAVAVLISVSLGCVAYLTTGREEY